MTPEERAAAIATAIGNKSITLSVNGAYGSVSIRVLAGTTAIGPMVRCSITAWTGAGGNRVDLPLGDGIFQFVNPPLAVPDGGTDPEGNKTFTRDDLAAARAMVYDAVTGCALRNGWTP